MRYVYLDKPDYDRETQILYPEYKIEDGTFFAGWKIEEKTEDGYVNPSDEIAEEAPVLTAEAWREQAYNSDPCVPWDGDMLTVTQAAQQWAYYAAEGRSDKTDELTALIAAAKQRIRAKYPDEEVTGVANHRIQDLESAK